MYRALCSCVHYLVYACDITFYHIEKFQNFFIFIDLEYCFQLFMFYTYIFSIAVFHVRDFSYSHILPSELSINKLTIAITAKNNMQFKFQRWKMDKMELTCEQIKECVRAILFWRSNFSTIVYMMNDIFHNVTITYTYFCGFAHFQDSNGFDTTPPTCISMCSLTFVWRFVIFWCLV